VKAHAPPNSIIVAHDYKNPQDLGNHLVQLTHDRALYESYHQWRYQPIDTAFAEKYAFTNTHSNCRMCKFAYATRHGLAWNHSKQEIQEPFISHKTCRNKVGLVGHPFKEYWLTTGGETVAVTSSDGTKTCELASSNRVIDIDRGAILRKVYDQDGVTDLYISKKKGDKNYTLKLETPIASSDFFELDNDVRWLQDSKSRMTILTNGAVVPSVTEQGTVEILISSEMKVRIIVENVDHFHKGTREIPSYFGDLMVRDFLSPIQAYRL
jgi:hypothetical protein